MDTLTHETHPRFAVVGHPNKGKSSIVASLAMDDTVQISDTPGTTTRTRSFPLRIDGVTLYELFDTPGFQRARRVLAWLQSHEVRADERPDAVRAFIHEHRDDPRFNDEIELLTPIMDGAGILYVVDGAKPYGEEYQAEMEILRWTGQPSMALINTIGEGDYTDEWERALGQYFKLIRRYDPMDARFEDHVRLLEAIAQLRQEWVAPVKRSIALFETYRKQRLKRTAQTIAHLVQTSLSHVERMPYHHQEVRQDDREVLAERYRSRLRRMEADAQQNVERIWHHAHLEKDQAALLFDGIDLFSRKSASIFGLTRTEMMLTGMAAGAAAGAGVDLLLGGSTLLLGSAAGAVAGGVGAWWGFDELSEVRVLGTTLGRRTLEMGPMTNRNFPWIVLGRALYHAHTLLVRSHAVRGTVKIEMDEHFRERWIDEALRAELEKAHRVFSSGDDVSQEVTDRYEAAVYKALERIG